MLKPGATYHCPKCGKLIQKIYAKGKPQTVRIGVIRFSRCDYAMTKFFDLSGNLVRGYLAEPDYPYTCEPGYVPHDGECFVFPFERSA